MKIQRKTGKEGNATVLSPHWKGSPEMQRGAWIGGASATVNDVSAHGHGVFSVAVIGTIITISPMQTTGKLHPRS